jgi:putative hydrolase of HD superfamily
MRPRLQTALAALRLKDEPRRGWVLRGVEGPESVADHSWGTALLCLLFAEAAGVDLGEALAIATLHDLAEAVTGDVAARSDVRLREVSLEDKAVREVAAIDELLAGFDGAALRRRWDDYETSATPEARFVRDMNLIELCLQALAYQRGGRYPESTTLDGYAQLDEFFVTAGPRVRTELGRSLFAEVERAYSDARV